MHPDLVTLSALPVAVLEATVQRSANAGGLARLATESATHLRIQGHQLRGCIALRQVRAATPGSGARLAWSFHGWELPAVREAAARLTQAWPQWAEGTRLQGIQLMEGQAWRAPITALPAADEELCLQFDTPLRWLDPVPLMRPQLGAAQLLLLLGERLRSVTGQRLQLSDADAQFSVITHYGHLDWAGARLANGGRMANFQGALFLRHASAGLVQLLARLQPWHLVQGRDEQGVVWRGAYRMRVQREGWLDGALLKRERMAVTAYRLVNQHDTQVVYDTGGKVVPPLEVAERLLAQLRQLRYTPQPTEAFDLHRPGHAPRRVERLALPDQLAQAHALSVLGPVLERVFEPSSYGYRPGRSRHDAIEQVRAALREGFTHVLESDIAQCFPSVNHAVLDGLLDQLLLRSDRALRHLLHAAVRQPWVMQGVRHERPVGLAQDAPLAPALTNLMLTELDRTLDAKRWRYVRYADDFLVLARSRADAQAALAAVSQVLGSSHLQLAEHKTRIGPVQAGFTFLGEHFGAHSGEDAPPAVAAQRKPMVVTEPFLSLGVNGQALEARRQQALVGVWPLRRLSEILVLERATLSTALIDRCAQLDIPVAVTSGYGGHVQLLGNGQRRLHESQLAHALWHHALGDGARLALAKEVVDSKLHNQAQLVAQRRGQAELVLALREMRHQAQGATTLAALRGHEGQAARRVFAWLQLQVVPAQRPLFSAKKRARGGPDRLNALLNFLYFLLNVRVAGMVRVLGLNPYLGWLHDGVEDYETLVYDLMEPFRPFVDRLALRLVNRLELRAAQFDDSSGAFRLSREATRHVVERFEEALGERVQGAVLRELLWHQGRSVRALVTGKGPLWLYHWEPRHGLDSHDEPQVLNTDTPV